VRDDKARVDLAVADPSEEWLEIMLHVGLAGLESQCLVHQRAERTLVVDSRRQVTASQLMNFCPNNDCVIAQI
jgi:hypothetical protein